MKYTSIILVMLLFLTGCTKMTQDFNADISNKINEVATEKSSSPYYNHKYYSYNIESYIGRISSDKTSNVFSYNGTKFIMNLNIPSILGEDTNLNLVKDSIYESNGEYIDYNNVAHRYNISVYDIEADYMITTNTDYVTFYSVCSKNEIASLCAEMLTIAKTVKINLDLIKNDYSDRDTIVYHREQLELFKNIVPENGAIDELFESNHITDNTDTSEGDGIDGDYNAPTEENVEEADENQNLNN